ncbi:MAG TPA: DUF1559 domain-containing protein [Abditibacteriaceae bacterium]|jgi:prepilin-type N-terminal cleavage/methylation domain-containing protein/prepilin-type processing-associated H-X9-DG protein
MKIAHRSLPQARFSGFTLIEILVVVAILALLAAILFPVFGRARENGRAASCSSNLKQIGLGLAQYESDNDGFYPTAGGTILWDVTDVSTGRASWMQQINPYLKSRQILRCASDSRSDYSYFLSTRVAFLEAGNFAPVFAPRIAFTDKFILAGDTGGFQQEDADKDDYTQNCVGGTSNGTPAMEWQQHNGRQNILFADGHVKRFGGFNAELMTFGYDTMKGWP